MPSSGAQSSNNGQQLPKVSGHGVSIAVPDSSWQLNQTVPKGVKEADISAIRPLALDNFQHAFRRGGLVPQGGASIDVSSVPLPSGSVQDEMTRELKGVEGLRFSNTSVEGNSATTAKYQDSYPGGLTFSNIAVFVPRGNLLYKFFLTYNASDPQASSYITAFQKVLNSANFAQ